MPIELHCIALDLLDLIRTFVTHGMALARHGTARHDMAWHVMARDGTAQHGSN